MAATPNMAVTMLKVLAATEVELLAWGEGAGGAGGVAVVVVVLVTPALGGVNFAGDGGGLGGERGGGGGAACRTRDGFSGQVMVAVSLYW